ISPYLESFTGMANLKGRVSGDLDLKRSADGMNVAKGSVQTAGLVLPIARPGTPPLDAKADVDLEVHADGTATIRRFDVDSGHSSLRSSGSVEREYTKNQSGEIV